jgi:hypothetical protein
VNDRSDELSTADLAGQSAGSGSADERAVRGEPVDRTGERDDAFPGDRSADADYADDRGDYADDRVGGMGARGFPGGTPADRAAYADDDPTTATDRGGYADDASLTGDRGGYAEGAAVGGDRAAYADARTGAEAAGAPTTDDRGFGGRGLDDDRGSATGGMREPAAASASGLTGNGVAGTEAGPLLAGQETEGFRARWTDVQTGFVDAPRRSVEQADALVADLMQHLAKSFADERSRLESQWDRGEDIPTDDLRTAFQRYRSFFERLLAT